MIVQCSMLTHLGELHNDKQWEPCLELHPVDFVSLGKIILFALCQKHNREMSMLRPQDTVVRIMVSVIAPHIILLSQPAFR